MANRKQMALELARQLGIDKQEFIDTLGDDISDLSAVEWAACEQFGFDFPKVCDMMDDICVSMS